MNKQLAFGSGADFASTPCRMARRRVRNGYRNWAPKNQIVRLWKTKIPHQGSRDQKYPLKRTSLSARHPFPRSSLTRRAQHRQLRAVSARAPAHAFPTHRPWHLPTEIPTRARAPRDPTHARQRVANAHPTSAQPTSASPQPTSFPCACTAFEAPFHPSHVSLHPTDMTLPSPRPSRRTNNYINA